MFRFTAPKRVKYEATQHGLRFSYMSALSEPPVFLVPVDISSSCRSHAVLHILLLKFCKSLGSASSATPFSHAKTLGPCTASSQEPEITTDEYGDTARVAKRFMLNYQAVKGAYKVP
jgi:hypothetical protein